MRVRRPHRVAFLDLDPRLVPLKRWPKLLYREFRAMWQRAWRGYADMDTWSLDWYLASWLPDAIAQLAAPVADDDLKALAVEMELPYRFLSDDYGEGHDYDHGENLKMQVQAAAALRHFADRFFALWY